jgi:hypothetical protein
MSKKKPVKKDTKEFGEHPNRIPKKLTKIPRPETIGGKDDYPMIDWKPINKGLMIGGYITQSIVFPNKFGGSGRMLVMDLLEFKHPKSIKKPGESIKLFVPAMLEKLLVGVNFKGYVRIKYLGKEEIQGQSQASHQFDVEAELYEGIPF